MGIERDSSSVDLDLSDGATSAGSVSLAFEELYEAMFAVAFELDLAAGRGLKAITSATYTVTALDNTLLLDGSGNSVVVTLPLAINAVGRRFTFKCVDSTNAVSFKGSGLELIDTSNVQSIAYLQFRTVQSDGSAWHIIG